MSRYDNPFSSFRPIVSTPMKATHAHPHTHFKTNYVDPARGTDRSLLNLLDY